MPATGRSPASGPVPYGVTMWDFSWVTRRWGDGASWQLDSKVYPPEATFLRLDCAKAKGRLDWRPALPFESALEWLVDWYRERHRGADVRELTLRRITDYEALLGHLETFLEFAQGSRRSRRRQSRSLKVGEHQTHKHIL